MTNTDPTIDTTSAAERAPYINVQAVAGIRDDYQARLSEIDASTSLTKEGRDIEAATLYLEAQQQMAKHEATYQAAVDTGRTTSARRLFGPTAADPATIMSHRDALQRADQLDNPEAATTALDRARFSNDESMIRAITLRAAHKNWDDVLTDVERAAPGTAKKLAAHRAIPPTSGLQHNMFFGVRAPTQFVSRDGAVDTYKIRAAAAKAREAATLR
ncbi:hypothetical protein O1W68_07715 [Rhodococcus sp. H36-A4]|uniref:hypothetical protein n=1 Tax=Rhodococcus sp. H36-A4 TaxID=3004353 RepID=UPI0022AEA0D0|nr:hypothetical protein [Rhodococcus sp. H36-A4]MCZ4077822.1 hypothetical protein [Rhodococcus sp. H36-A4]